MKFAIQEAMLPGRSVFERLQQARAAGLDGVEFDARSLTERVPEIVDALAQTGVQAAAVNLGRRDGYLSPVLAEREGAIGAMRQAMADALDIGAAHVVFVPHYGGPKMPDLTPYRAPIELESEMMIWLLRTVSDLAYAMDVELDMLPVNHFESYFINRLDQAAFFRRKVKDHPHIRIAAHLFHMALEEADALGALRTLGQHIGYVYLSDSNCRLPGQGLTDFAAVAAALRDVAYTGWLTLTCDSRHLQFRSDFAASLQMLKSLGL